VAAGLSLHEAARQAGVDIEVPCGRCFVRVTRGEVEGDNAGRLPAPALAAGYVLACRTRLLDSPVTVEVPERLTLEEGQFADDETLRLIEPGLLPTPEQIDSLIARRCLTVPPPAARGWTLRPRPPHSRPPRPARPGGGGPTLSVLRSVAQALRAEAGQVHGHREPRDARPAAWLSE
jgi:hypothetical protein